MVPQSYSKRRQSQRRVRHGADWEYRQVANIEVAVAVDLEVRINYP